MSSIIIRKYAKHILVSMLRGPFRKLVRRVCTQRKFIEESLYGLRCGEEWPGHSIALGFGSRLCLPLRCSVSILWHCSNPCLILDYDVAAVWNADSFFSQPYKVKFAALIHRPASVTNCIRQILNISYYESSLRPSGCFMK